MAKKNNEENYFTREQLHEYFSDRFLPEQVNKALEILANQGEVKFDPHGDQFSIDITSQLEEVFNVVGAALESQKSLGNPEHEQITKLDQGAVYSQHSNPALVAAITRMIVEQTIEDGMALNAIRSKVMDKVLEQGDMVLAQSIQQRGVNTSGLLQTLASDDSKINTMLGGYGVQKINIDAFLEEVRGNTLAVKESVRAIAPTPKTFDIDAFLLEAGK